MIVAWILFVALGLAGSLGLFAYLVCSGALRERAGAFLAVIDLIVIVSFSTTLVGLVQVAEATL